jgi:hypothetical protein
MNLKFRKQQRLRFRCTSNTGLVEVTNYIIRSNRSGDQETHSLGWVESSVRYDHL